MEHVGLLPVTQDKITTDLQEVKIQNCKCGYLGTKFYEHIWRHHREFINPENGLILENVMVKLLANRKNGQNSNRQETSHKADNRASWQAQDVRIKQRSDLQEIADRESIEDVRLTTEDDEDDDADEAFEKYLPQQMTLLKSKATKK